MSIDRRKFLIAAAATGMLSAAKKTHGDGPLRVRATREELESWDARVYFPEAKSTGDLFWRNAEPNVDDEVVMFDGPFSGKRFVARDLASAGETSQLLVFLEEIEYSDLWHMKMQPRTLTMETFEQAIKEMRERPRRRYEDAHVFEMNGKIFKR